MAKKPTNKNLTKPKSKPKVDDSEKAFHKAIKAANPGQREKAQKTIARAMKRAHKIMTTPEQPPKPKAEKKTLFPTGKVERGELPPAFTDAKKPEYKPTLAMKADRELYSKLSSLPKHQQAKWAEDNFDHNPLVATHIAHGSLLKSIASGEKKFRGSVRNPLVNIAKSRQQYFKEEAERVSLAEAILQKYRKNHEDI